MQRTAGLTTLFAGLSRGLNSWSRVVSTRVSWFSTSSVTEPATGTATKKAQKVGRIFVDCNLKSNVYKMESKRVKGLASATLEYLRLSAFDVAVYCVGTKTITELNYDYRDIKEPTDVLAFPMEEPEAPGKPVAIGPVKDMGELYVCIPYIEKQAKARGPEGMLSAEFPVVLVHGLLHLAGYDHHTAEAREEMQGVTDAILAHLHAKRLVSEQCIALANQYELEEAPPAAQITLTAALDKSGASSSSSSGSGATEQTLVLNKEQIEQLRRELQAEMAANGRELLELGEGEDEEDDGVVEVGEGEGEDAREDPESKVLAKLLQEQGGKKL